MGESGFVGAWLTEWLFPVLAGVTILITHLAFVVHLRFDVASTVDNSPRPLSDHLYGMLVNLNLERHVQLFLAHRIDDKNISLLEKSDLLYMGLPVGDAIKVVSYIKDGIYEDNTSSEDNE